jgi:hypothetical protein
MFSEYCQKGFPSTKGKLQFVLAGQCNMQDKGGQVFLLIVIIEKITCGDSLRKHMTFARDSIPQK